MLKMSRRASITLLGGVAAWPVTMRAQQAQGMPIVGFLHPGVPESGSPVFDALREGLRETGYVEGENVRVEARWARGRPGLLPQLTQELIQLRPAVLIATARPSIEAPRSATSTLPIFANDLESDPVASGYVEVSHIRAATHWCFFGCPDIMRQVAAANRRDGPKCEQSRSTVGRDDRHVSARCDQGRGKGKVD